MNNIPKNIQSQNELTNIIPLLKSNFLTKNLSDDEITNLAGAMQKESFNKGDLIIKYGDIG